MEGCARVVMEMLVVVEEVATEVREVRARGVLMVVSGGGPILHE